jgi:hypothetical protein
MSRLKTDKLLASVYAHHGDTCSLAPHCKSLGCASGHGPDDYVLSARFAYLQEAIDYCQAVALRGVRSRLVSRIVPTAPYTSDYPKLNPDLVAGVRQ